MVKEGILFVVVPFLIGLILLLLKIPYVSFIGALTLYLLAGFCAFFFRDPHRQITAPPQHILSPVDGTVLAVTDHGGRRTVDIFLSLFNVHVTRLPGGGTVTALQYNKGKFLPAFRDKASDLNESMTVLVQSGDFDYSLKLIAGIAARRIRMWIHEGDTLQSGDKIGILMFGSRAQLTLPASVEIRVKKGDKVRGGLTLIAEISTPAVNGSACPE